MSRVERRDERGDSDDSDEERQGEKGKRKRDGGDEMVGKENGRGEPSWGGWG